MSAFVRCIILYSIEDGREFFLVLNQGFDTSDGVRAGRSEPLVKLQWIFRF